MAKYWIVVSGILAVAATPALAVGANCGDQLAQIKAQLSSETLAQSAVANKYQEAERLCSAGQDEQAQNLAQQLREEMAQKGAAGTSEPGANRMANEIRTTTANAPRARAPRTASAGLTTGRGRTRGRGPPRPGSCRG